MVTFIPAYVMEERRVWEVGMTPLLKDASTDADWERIGREFREQHGAPPLALLSHVADHIEHVVRIAGIDHVGIGSDFYGAQGDDLIQGLEDVSKFPELAAELVRRRWSDEDVAKLSRANLLRVFSDVEKTAAKLRRSRGPSLESIEELDGHRALPPN
jgi:membrane dipeptidase